MNGDRQKLEALFAAAIALGDARARAAFVEQACAGMNYSATSWTRCSMLTRKRANCPP